MEISSNLIRFPSSSTVVTPRHAEAQAKPDNVVDFPARSEEQSFDTDAQSHGQFFAAARIVGRVADQLDAIPNL